jgi:hypothetical protein
LYFIRLVKLDDCCKEQGRLAEASEEGLGSNWAVAPMMMMMMIRPVLRDFLITLYVPISWAPRKG